MTDQLAHPPVSTGPRHAAAPTPGRRRGPAIAGAAAGAVVVATVIGVGLALQPEPAARPAVIAAPPAPKEKPVKQAAADPLAVRPVVPAGHGKLRKLKVTALVAGAGPKIREGQQIKINYTLTAYADGRQITSSWDGGGPVPMVVGAGRLLGEGDRGLRGQRVGSRLRVDVPAALTEGRGAGDLRAVIDILAAK